MTSGPLVLGWKVLNPCLRIVSTFVAIRDEICEVGTSPDGIAALMRGPATGRPSRVWLPPDPIPATELLPRTIPGTFASFSSQAKRLLCVPRLKLRLEYLLKIEFQRR